MIDSAGAKLFREETWLTHVRSGDVEGNHLHCSCITPVWQEAAVCTSTGRLSACARVGSFYLIQNGEQQTRFILPQPGSYHEAKVALIVLTQAHEPL